MSLKDHLSDPLAVKSVLVTALPHRNHHIKNPPHSVLESDTLTVQSMLG